MANISISITNIGRNSVTISLNSSMVNTDSYYEEFMYYTVYTDSKETNKYTTTNSSYTVSYTPQNSGIASDYVNASVTYREYNWKDTSGYELYASTSYEDTESKSGTEFSEDYMYMFIYSSTILGTTENDDGTITTHYQISVNIYNWVSSGHWEDQGSTTTAIVWKLFFPAPDTFAFEGCVKGAKWLLKSGINSLITNIEDFYGVAQQWRRWSSQSAVTEKCPSFFNNNNELCATGLNNVYAYVGSSESFKSGNRVAASMFNNLADIINTTSYS